MRASSIGALLLAAACGLPSARTLAGADDPSDRLTLTLPSCDTVVRPPILFRLRIGSDIPPALFDEPGWELSIAIERDQDILSADHISLAHLGALCSGVAVVLAPALTTRPLLDAPALLQIDLTSADHRHRAHLERALPTVGSLAGQLGRERAALVRRDEPDPLPWLWADQGSEIAGAGDSAERCRALIELLGLLARADHGDIARDPVLQAWRDPTDQSTQPERRYQVRSGAPEAWVIGAPGEDAGVQKSDWPTLPSAWLAAAVTAGVAVVQPYPAGDRAWQGIALWRAERRLLATGHGRVTLVGVGSGAGAALRLAVAHPERVAAVRLVDPAIDAASLEIPGLAAAIVPLAVSQTGGAPLPNAPPLASAPSPADPAFWRARATGTSTQPAIATVLDPPASPLCGYARGPFVVVVGEGEHQAAHDDDELLARQFVEAWATHAQGVPPVVRDDAFEAARWRDHAWVLIGNARSNRAIAELGADRLSARWDDRSVTIQGQTYLRCERRLVAFSTRRRDGGWAVVIDGAWTPSGAHGAPLPLAGLGDPTVGSPTPLAPMASAP